MQKKVISDYLVKSVFSPELQIRDIDSRIISALERISEAFRILLWGESKNYGLSPIQIQIMVFIYLHNDNDKNTITYLSREFNLTKPTISDSVNTLLSKKLLVKKKNFSDSRSYYLVLTAQGRKIAGKLSSVGLSLKQAIQTQPESLKSQLYAGLLVIIKNLYDEKIINVQRMCFNCRYFNPVSNSDFYCKLLSTKLRYDKIRIDCPEHEPVAG